ncbi:hypothetical protein IQ255_14890 [Pleurocapsales cyanobacterium LEGE 10410]|nr:hypothetical protein [Pleurocapsales cyanobacterium LEGE 10410]
MMTGIDLKNRQEQLIEAAEEYRGKGYKILFPSDYEYLPEFISSYTPDLVVHNERETIAIKVVSREALNFTTMQYLSHLAKEVEKHSGWKLELLATKLKLEDIKNYLIAQDSLQINEIRAKVPIVKQLAESYPEAALLYCWCSLEATIRLLAEKEHLSLEEFDVKRLIKELVFNGIISRTQYQILQEAWRLRNVTAHGFKTHPIDRSYIQKIIKLQQDLLVELENN